MKKQEVLGIVKRMIARLKRAYEKNPLQETARALDSLYEFKVELEHR